MDRPNERTHADGGDERSFDSAGLNAMLMRGGTSKGLFILASDLPGAPIDRDNVLLAIMGSPDHRQIDGVGGGHPLTSKVAVICPSQTPDTDVDYLFLQVSVDQALVSDRQNCGNMLAGVGPFAVERGLAQPPAGNQASVRIRMVNTDSIATATFAVSAGMPVYRGETKIAGVPGAASPVRLDFEGIAGGSTGALFPTGSVVDELDGVPITLVDNGMPVVVMRADAMGISGYESPAELESNSSLRTRLETIRLQAGRAMHLGDVSDTTVPKLTMVAPPQTSGAALCTRTFIPHRCHEAIGVLGAVSVATAALTPGTPANEAMAPQQSPTVAIEHPTGVFEAVIELTVDADGRPNIERAGIVRTTRKLFDGVVFPR